MAGKTYPRLIRPPGQSFFLLGVRGVGKSSWARARFPDAPRIDLLDEARYQDYLADPSLFAADLQSAPPGSWVVVDEIQRLPQPPQRGPPPYRGAPPQLRPARIERAEAQGVGRQPARRPGAAQDDASPDPGRARRRLRPRCGPRHRNDSPCLGRRRPAGGARELCPALSPRGGPGGRAGPKPSGIRALPAGRRPLSRPGRQHIRHRARLRRRPRHGARLSGYPRGYPARVPPPRLPAAAQGAGAPPSEALLGRSRPGPRGEEAARGRSRPRNAARCWKAGSCTSCGRTASRAGCSTRCTTGRRTRRTAPRSTFCSAGTASWPRSRSSHSPATTPACCPVCAQSGRCRE